MNKRTALLEQHLSFRSLRLIHIDLPQKEQFVSGIGVRNSREAIIVEWEDQDGFVGYGECSCRPDPYYSAEFIEGSIALLRNFVVPFLAKDQKLGDLITVLEKIRGWNFTKAAIEMAALQVIEQNTGSSAFDLMNSEPIDQVPAGISLGLYSDFDNMASAVENALSTGYKRLKFKISPDVRIEFFETLSSVLLESDAIISFDANGSISENDIHILSYFVETFDSMIEQPFDPGRFDILLKAKKEIPGLYVCFDEEIKSIGDLVKLHRLGVLDEVNLKPGRVGGVLNSIQIIEYCSEHGIHCWIGGMFETGIGRTLNLRIASYLHDARAHDLSPSDRYFMEDLISPGVKMKDGFVDIESLKKSEVNSSSIKKYTRELYTFTP